MDYFTSPIVIFPRGFGEKFYKYRVGDVVQILLPAHARKSLNFKWSLYYGGLQRNVLGKIKNRTIFVKNQLFWPIYTLVLLTTDSKTKKTQVKPPLSHKEDAPTQKIQSIVKKTFGCASLLILKTRTVQQTQVFSY